MGGFYSSVCVCVRVCTQGAGGSGLSPALQIDSILKWRTHHTPVLCITREQHKGSQGAAISKVPRAHTHTHTFVHTLENLQCIWLLWFIFFKGNKHMPTPNTNNTCMCCRSPENSHHGYKGWNSIDHSSTPLLSSLCVCVCVWVWVFVCVRTVSRRKWAATNVNCLPVCVICHISLQKHKKLLFSFTYTDCVHVHHVNARTVLSILSLYSNIMDYLYTVWALNSLSVDAHKLHYCYSWSNLVTALQITLNK